MVDDTAIQDKLRIFFEEIPDVMKPSVALMRAAGERCLNAEKLAWVLQYVMIKQPNDDHTMVKLMELLHEYLALTASQVKAIPALREAERRINGESAGSPE